MKTSNMRTVRDIKIFHNIPILVRASLNVPVENGVVMNNYRLRRAIPTIRYLAERGARVVIISHLGEQGTETLSHVAAELGRLISEEGPTYVNDVGRTFLKNVSFFNETIGSRARAAVRELLPGNILVLENLRRNRGEGENDPSFAEELASLADIFVEDAFDTCHRPHASIVGIPKILPSYAGILLEEEIKELASALTPKHPSLAVIGGAKFHTKEALLTTLLKKYDNVFVGGALANDFLKASGQNVRKSLVSTFVSDPMSSVSDAMTSVAQDRSIKKLLENKKLIVPIDSIFSDEKIVDHGPKTRELLANLAHKAKTILWNGPLGKCEDGFFETTNNFAMTVAHCRARSIVGGGDTVAAIENLNLLHEFSFVSTGGGAMLDFLADGTLPGITALCENRNNLGCMI